MARKRQTKAAARRQGKKGQRVSARKTGGRTKKKR